MKIKMVAVVVLSSVLVMAQAAPPANSTPAKPDAGKSMPEACQKMMEGKAMDSCCMNDKTAQPGEQKMSCCQGKKKDGKAADPSSAKSDKMACCQGKDGKEEMACMKADKDKKSAMSCSDSKGCEGADMKDCCAGMKADDTAAGMEHCSMMGEHDHSDMK